MKIYTVRELTELIKSSIESGFPDVTLTGEISNYKLYSSGHSYFSLKDEFSQIKAIIFNQASQALKFNLEDGIKVIVSGRVSVYVKRGDYSVIVDHISPAGKGALQLAFEQLKEKLIREGLFEQGRKRPIPLLPDRVGVVTSPDGAALRDILSVFRQKAGHFHILLYPVQVQGDRAKDDIAEALRYLNENHPELDVLLVGRGGGSLEDLWAFNEEVVARAIAASAIPVISCVGHEVDFTIADFVADLRSPTPTAAAEYIVKNRNALEDRFASLSVRLQRNLTYFIDNVRRRISAALGSRIFRNPQVIIEQRIQQLDDVSGRLVNTAERFIGDKQGALRLCSEKINVLSPLSILSRGYSITWKLPERALVKNAGAAGVRDLLLTRTARGEIISRVTEVRDDEKKTELKFEEALRRLEEIVDKLESGEAELDESIKIFEEGMEMVRLCQGKLDEIGKKIEVLAKEGEKLVPKKLE